MNVSALLTEASRGQKTPCGWRSRVLYLPRAPALGETCGLLALEACLQPTPALVSTGHVQAMNRGARM